MKPPPFAWTAPDSVDAALELLAEAGDEAKILAGGQSLLPLLNFRLARPSLLVDLNRVGGLDFVRATGEGGLSIGAMTRQRSLEREPLVAERLPLLRESARHIAHPQIRNRGTIGGSLAHADPAAELPAVAVALGARLLLRGTGGERWVAAEDFYVGLLATALDPGEMVVEIEIPALPSRSGWSFLEVARRHGDYAQAGVVAIVEVDEAAICTRARLVYFAVGDGPVRAPRAAALLEGERLADGAIGAAARVAADEETDPAGDIHASAPFKRHLVGVLTRRALHQAAARAGAAAGGSA